MDNEAQFKERLRATNERLTSPRLITFRALARKAPLSTVKLVALLEGNGINAATTYRNLALFRRLGVIQDIVADGQRLVELNEDFGSHHHHFWCTQCGKLQDFDNPDIDKSIEELSGKLGIKITGHQLEMSGLCSSCLAKGQEPTDHSMQN
jgi:Fur family ferric uptake transcriptional regulator